ncbi:MAG TPA: hypothetical protein GX693_01260 [Firmicutes bacterium]|nr:hypothetical protein [Bacillota bacterium]
MRPRRRRKDFEVIPGEGRRDIYYKQAAIYYIILSLVIVLLCLTGYRWLGNIVLARRLQVVTAEPGFLEDSYLLEGVIVRSEQVIYSPCSGLLLELAPAGERVAVGSTLATIFKASPEELLSYQEQPEINLWDQITGFIRRKLGGGDSSPPPPVYVIPAETGLWPERVVELDSQIAGFVSAQIDGWENAECFPYLDQETYDQRAITESQVVAGTYVEEGRPVLKIVNDWDWYYSTLLPLNPGEELAGQEKIWLNFSFAPQETVEAFLEEVRTDLGPEVIGLTYRLERQIDGFEKVRWVGATAVYQRYQGVLVPTQTLCHEPETGVLVDEGGIAIFYPVEIIKIQQEQALVEGLPPYSRVITRPDLITEGYRLN